MVGYWEQSLGLGLSKTVWEANWRSSPTTFCFKWDLRLSQSCRDGNKRLRDQQGALTNYVSLQSI